MKKILIMAGGTGGHVIPALTIAKKMQQQNVEVAWLGTRRGIEAQLVAREKIPIYYLSIHALRGTGWVRKITAPFILSWALLQAIHVMLRCRPDIVLGMGGFASGPGGVAAWLLRKPLVIHEQNAVAGMTNQILARFAKKSLSAFPAAFPRHIKTLTIGNPVRDEIINLQPVEKRFLEHQGKPLHILVLGGSHGALVLNQTVPHALHILKEQEAFKVWHQCGKHHWHSAKDNYQRYQVPVKLEIFIEKMHKAYAWADIVICRAGALTVSELACAGVASILIPYPYAVDDHQTKNAEFLAQEGAAFIMQEKHLLPEKLAEQLFQLAKYRQKLLLMAKQARQIFVGNAAERIVENCLHLSS